MQSVIYTLLGVVVGGMMTWGIQYFFRKEERKWEQKKELKNVAMEALDIVHELIYFYDTYPQPEQVDEAYMQSLNDRTRKTRVKVNVMFSKKDDKIVEAFEEATRAVKGFMFAEKGERLKISITARKKVKEFDKVVQEFFSNL